MTTLDESIKAVTPAKAGIQYPG